MCLHFYVCNWSIEITKEKLLTTTKHNTCEVVSLPIQFYCILFHLDHYKICLVSRFIINNKCNKSGLNAANYTCDKNSKNIQSSAWEKIISIFKQRSKKIGESFGCEWSWSCEMHFFVVVLFLQLEIRSILIIITFKCDLK